MQRTLRDIKSKDFCTVYGNGTVERTRFEKDLMSGWKMSFWQIDRGDPNARIAGWSSTLSDMEPDKNYEFSATYIVDHKHYREGVYLTERGIFIYRPCANAGHCEGIEQFSCDQMDYPGVSRIVASAAVSTD